MHVPDGLLDLKTAGTTAVVSLSALTVALRRLRLGLPRRRVPLMGLAAAFLFTAQMLNFPVAGGTSGHLLGAVLAAVLLGPSAAVVVMTAVLLVQCLLFADGGLLALGANVFNMAIVGVLGGLAVYKAVSRAAAWPARPARGGRVRVLVLDAAGLDLLRGGARLVPGGALGAGLPRHG